MPEFKVPSLTGEVAVSAEFGKSLVLLGANGSGKTRLGAEIETVLGQHHNVHRIGAHRSLILNTRVQPPSFEMAERAFLYGYAQAGQSDRLGHRWGNKPATHLVSDFDHLVSALYADENRISVLHRQAHLKDTEAKPPATKLDDLKMIWHRLLPHRRLLVEDNTIKVLPTGDSEDQWYDAGELSDGERVIFYLIGQILLIRRDCLLIVDEPELHINRAILPQLWDALESKRKDCAFIYLTHDIEFTVTRRSATKYVVRSFVSVPSQVWDIEAIPDASDLTEETITKIAGSRLPILFAEGNGGSLDAAIYRRVYPDWTVVPVGSGGDVVHAVVSFRKHSTFHRLGCAGIIDEDGRSPEETTWLATFGVATLSATEIENVLMLPEPFKELARLLQFDVNGTAEKLEELKTVIFAEARRERTSWARNASRRAIDRKMKSIGLESLTIDDLNEEFSTKVDAIDIRAIYEARLGALEAMLAKLDYAGVVRVFDNKGLLAHAARILGQKSRKDLEELVGRALQNEDGQRLLNVIKAELPKLSAS